MKILLIEDDIQLNTTITNFLKFKNYDVTSCDDGLVAIELIDDNNFDFYIIDINIPSIDGLEVVKYIRNKDFTTPILMITASLELSNFKTAFENGCNEYIKKPFYLEELEIRMANLTEKINEKENIINISHNITYDLEFEELRVDKELIRLRKKEKRLLTILIKNMNKIVNTEVIENYVWENEIKDSYPLRQLVNELRKHIENGHKFIFSEVGIGYRFESDYEENR